MAFNKIPFQAVPTHLRVGKGRKYRVTICETMTVPIDAGLWDGGSRDTYEAVELASGRVVPFPDQNLYYDGRQARTVLLRNGFAVRRHSIFMGKDSGYTYFIHPSNATLLLPSA